MNIVILISGFRGISEYLIYLDNKSKFNPSVYKYNYKKILNFIYYLFILIFILSLLYILIISFLYKNIYFNEANWQYFPLFIECIIHYFFIYPFIIIKLYKNSNIIFKNDYIITYIFAIPSFIVFELYTFFFPKNINIGIYIKCFFDFLCYNGYCIFPFIDVIKYKNKINKRLSLLVNENIKDFEDNNLHYKFIKDYYNLILQKQNVNNIFNINKILENKFDEKKIGNKNHRDNYIKFYYNNKKIIENNYDKKHITQIENNIKNGEINYNMFDPIKDYIIKEVYLDIYEKIKKS